MLDKLKEVLEDNNTKKGVIAMGPDAAMQLDNVTQMLDDAQNNEGQGFATFMNEHPNFVALITWIVMILSTLGSIRDVVGKTKGEVVDKNLIIEQILREIQEQADSVDREQDGSSQSDGNRATRRRHKKAKGRAAHGGVTKKIDSRDEALLNKIWDKGLAAAIVFFESYISFHVNGDEKRSTAGYGTTWNYKRNGDEITQYPCNGKSPMLNEIKKHINDREWMLNNQAKLHVLYETMPKLRRELARRGINPEDLDVNQLIALLIAGYQAPDVLGNIVPHLNWVNKELKEEKAFIEQVVSGKISKDAAIKQAKKIGKRDVNRGKISSVEEEEKFVKDLIDGKVTKAQAIERAELKAVRGRANAFSDIASSVSKTSGGTDITEGSLKRRYWCALLHEGLVTMDDLMDMPIDKFSAASGFKGKELPGRNAGNGWVRTFVFKISKEVVDNQIKKVKNKKTEKLSAHIKKHKIKYVSQGKKRKTIKSDIQVAQQGKNKGKKDKETKKVTNKVSLQQGQDLLKAGDKAAKVADKKIAEAEKAMKDGKKKEAENLRKEADGLYKEANKKYAESIKKYEQFIKENKDNSAVYSELALVYKKSGEVSKGNSAKDKYEQGCKVAQKGLSKIKDKDKDERAKILFNAGMLRENLGKFYEDKQDLKAARVQLGKAATNFKLANEAKPNPAYKQALERVNKKINSLNKVGFKEGKKKANQKLAEIEKGKFAKFNFFGFGREG